MNIKEAWKKFWFIVWKDNSPKGWIFTVIFLFVLIKFIVFPGLTLLTGTVLPLAIVESCSMYHSGNLISNFNSWWERHDNSYSDLGIEKNRFKNFIFEKGLNKGDILLVLGANPEKLKIGDVIIFEAGTNHPVIHRIVSIRQQNGEYLFSTKGDNVGIVQNFEKEIRENQLVGKAIFKPAPYLGWGKLIFFEPFISPSKRGFCEEN